MSIRHRGAGLRSTLQGISNRIKYTLQGPRQGLTQRFTKFLDTTGSNQVIKLEIARKPVDSKIQTALNVLSLGAYDKVRKKMGYDSVNHHYMLATLSDGTTYVIEKNAVVEQRMATAADLLHERYQVPLNPTSNLTLKEMVERARTTDKGQPASTASQRAFAQYNPKDANCQDFVGQMLEDNDLPLPPQLAPQDGNALVNSLGPLSGLPKLITDTGATLDRTYYGDSVGIKRGGGLQRALVFKSVR